MVLAPKMDKHKKKDKAGILLTCFFYIVISEVNLFLLEKKVEKKKRAHRHAFRLHAGFLTNPVRLSGQ